MNSDGIKKIVIFTSGHQNEGGDRLEKMIMASRICVIPIEITGVVSNYASEEVRKIAEEKNLNFFHLPDDAAAIDYQSVCFKSQAEAFILIDWRLPIDDLKPETAFNKKTVIRIYPDPLINLENSSGTKMYRRIFSAFARGEINKYEIKASLLKEDGLKIFAKKEINISPGDTRRSIEQKFKQEETSWYHQILAEIFICLAQKKENFI